MASKRKKALSPWLSCSKCFCQMHERDLNCHEIACTSTGIFNHPYVLLCKLHCLLNFICIKDAPVCHIPPETLNSLVFLSDAALQLCKITIGSWAIISTESGQEFVLKAWKSSDNAQLSASLCSIGLSSIHKEKITVESFDAALELAKEIILDGDVDVDKCQFLLLLQQVYFNRVVKVGNSILIDFYGRAITLKISHIKPAHKGAVNDFYQVGPDSHWAFNEVEKSNSLHLPIILPASQLLIVDEINAILAAVTADTAFKDNLKVRGVLVSGPIGTGKSFLIKSVASKWSKNIIKITYDSCFNQGSSLTDYFASVFRRAQRSAPSIIIIDDVDSIFEKCDGSDGGEALALAVLFDQLHNFGAAAVILATTSNIRAVSRSLRRPGRFECEIEIAALTAQDRLDILESLCMDYSVDKHDLKELADCAHGFVCADIVSLVTKAAILAAKEKSHLCSSHIRRCFTLIRPSAMKEIILQVSNVTWKEVGGQESLKHKLRQAVEWPLKYPESFKRLGVAQPRGLLMYGPPGCSKTMIAKALATESGLNFFSIKGPEIFSCWVGDSEKAIRDLFRRARQAAPSIIFFDELDSLAGERAVSSSAGSHVQDRVLAQMLTEMDGVEALGDVIVVGATNRPDRIDPALLRPGRLDRIIYVPLPDSSTRSAIFRIQFEKTPIASDVNLDELVEKTKGYSGAELVATCREAAMDALSEDLSSKLVFRRNFIAALNSVKASTSETAIALCEKYKNRQNFEVS